MNKSLLASFQNPKLLDLALTHKSFSNEKKLSQKNNEKLEFLGDAVLDLALTELLMQKFPKDKEGQLSKKRASLVNEESLASLAKSIGLQKLIRLGKGEISSGGRGKPRLLASGLEALIGAKFADSSYEETRALIFELFMPRIEELKPELDFEKDFKTRLQEITQKKKACAPVYEITHYWGSAHQRTFIAEVSLAGKWLARGLGNSKKLAEQKAAEKVLKGEDSCFM